MYWHFHVQTRQKDALVTKLLEDHRNERIELYQRIQAPQLTVAKHEVVTDDEPAYISPFDDDGFHDYKTGS